MRVTLTGAAGNVGSVVCEVLASRGHDVLAVDRVERGNLPVKLNVADLLDADAARAFIENADAVVHLANHPGHVENEGLRILRENLAMNANVFDAAAQGRPNKVVFASSIQVIASIPVFGPDPRPMPPYLPQDESVPPNPTNPYALSKALSESMLAYYGRVGAMGTVALRLPWMTRQAATRSARADLISASLAYLTMRDLGELIHAILCADLPGHRVYMPASRRNITGLPAREAVAKFYPGVPLRNPIGKIDSLVDINTIARETGWTPKDI